MSFDIDRMNKFPPGSRFFDLNEIWYFSNHWTVRFLYPLPVTANQITFLSLVMGVLSAGFYFSSVPGSLLWGAFFLYLKIYMDNVDGNLARVRGEVSRLGRFFDSLTDFSVTFLVYAAITFQVVQETGKPAIWMLGTVALVSALLHCSYFVFYMVSYASKVGTYSANRVHERVTEEDEKADASDAGRMWELLLQKIHVWVYGWQDSAIQHLDGISRRLAGLMNSRHEGWYSDRVFLTLSSPLCLCTNNMVLVFCSLFDCLEEGLWLIAVAGNGYLLGLQVWKILGTRWRGNES